MLQTLTRKREGVCELRLLLMRVLVNCGCCRDTEIGNPLLFSRGMILWQSCREKRLCSDALPHKLLLHLILCHLRQLLLLLLLLYACYGWAGLRALFLTYPLLDFDR